MHREALLDEIRAELARYARRELLEKLATAGIPGGDVFGLYEALASGRTAQAGLLQQVESEESVIVPVMAPPYQFEGRRVPVRAAPPLLGEVTASVLQGLLGLDDKMLTALAAKGVV